MGHIGLDAIDPRELGKRLQAARKASGRTQQDAAEELKVARTTMTAIESGSRRLQVAELARLALLYGRSVGELLRPGVAAEGFLVQLRAALDASVQEAPGEEVPLLEFQAHCEDYVALEQLCHAPLPSNYPPQYSLAYVPPKAAAEDVANAERNRLGLGDGPLLNLREILEYDVGLRIFFLALPSKISAMFAYTETLGGCIAVNRKHPADRRRISLCHEYGHFLTKRYQSEIAVAGAQYQRSPQHESFANAFANAFLMPASGLSRRYNELHRIREGRVTLADICTLAHLYFVSVEALMLRLEDLRFLSVGTWDRRRQQGFRVREAQALLQLPERPDDAEEVPARYRYLAATAYSKGDLSEGQFAGYLHVDRLEARRIAEELASLGELTEEGMATSVSPELEGPRLGDGE